MKKIKQLINKSFDVDTVEELKKVYKEILVCLEDSYKDNYLFLGAEKENESFKSESAIIEDMNAREYRANLKLENKCKRLNRAAYFSSNF